MRFKNKNTKISFIFLILIVLAVGFYLNFFFENKNKIIDNYKCPDCNVIIISVTNLRYDHLSSNGYFRKTSPNIDKFAEESIVFENAFSPVSWTLSAGISLFTSLYPFEHKVMNRFNDEKINSSITTMIDILKGNGYKTAAFTGGFDYSPKFGLTSRFDVISSTEDAIEENPDNLVQAVGSLVSSAPDALEWVKNNKDKKFFLFLQGYDVHCPFTPPEPYNKLFDPEYNSSIDYSLCLWTFDKTSPIFEDNKRYYIVKTSSASDQVGQIKLGEDDINHLVALYDGEIAYADSIIGDFLDGIKKMGLYKNTIIILISEHGDVFGKYGRFMRGGPLRGTFYDDVIHVPLMIKHPKLKPKRVNGLTQLLDVMPTIMDFLGVQNNNKVVGKTMLPLITNDTDVHDFILGGSVYGGKPQSILFNLSSEVEFIRSKEMKLIRERIFLDNGEVEETYELYNLKEDAEELNNVYYNEDIKIKKAKEDLKKRLFDWLEQFNQTASFKYERD